MSRPTNIPFPALRRRALMVLALTHAACAHGIDPSALSGVTDASGSHADGSATALPSESGGEAGSGGSSSTISGGSAGEAGSGGTDDLADAEGNEIGPGGSSSVDATDAARTNVQDASDASRPVDAAPDSGCPNPTACALRAALVHRYTFDGSGATATDSIGTADGTIMNTTLTSTGSLVLAGGVTDQYVDLPNHIVNQLTNATFEVWLTWSGGGNWQRIFDFGNSDSATENVQGNGSSTLHMTPLADGAHVLRFAFKRADQTVAQETDLEATMPLASGVVVHVAGVVDDTNNMMYLYRDGVAQGSKAFTDSLSLLNDINNWLGRSQYASDPELGGALHEFRIYNAALSAAQVQASFAAGQNPAYLPN